MSDINNYSLQGRRKKIQFILFYTKKFVYFSNFIILHNEVIAGYYFIFLDTSGNA